MRVIKKNLKIKKTFRIVKFTLKALEPKNSKCIIKLVCIRSDKLLAVKLVQTQYIPLKLNSLACYS